MKIRLIALAGVAALALSTPAMATEGWYLGLGAGWDHQNKISIKSTAGSPVPLAASSLKSSDGAIVAGAFGYAWDNGLRVEWEDSYTSHSFKAGNGGSDSLLGFMVNAVYDIPLGDNWKLSLGGGAGMGRARIHATGTIAPLPVANGGTGDLVLGSQTGFQWQGIAGIAYSISPDVDLFADFRYRGNEVNTNYPSFFTAYGPTHVS
ncbi:MAG TPA: outer membrane beta-barrel protein, partial [Rhizomicrobium sp.]|nr:outer membrane beta-barrel protein [Rhizomicrobium sp.]